MNEEIKYAGFWSRVVATIVDTIWLYGIIYTAIFFLLGSNALVESGAIMLVILSLEWIVPAIVVLTFWILKSATPGKMLLGIKIVDANTMEKVSAPRLLLRYVGYFVSMFPLFLGLFWVGWDKRKQGWHDKIARTVLVKI